MTPAAAPAREYLPGHGDRRFAVRHYALDLDYKVITNHLSGTAVLTALALEQLSEFALDLAGLQVSKVSVDGRRPDRYTHRGSRLLIRLARPVSAGEEFVVRISYGGKPRPVRGIHGSCGWEELTDGVLVGSQPDGAPSWFPCNDRLDDKATYTVTTTVPASYRVAGNGVLAPGGSRSGRTTFTFEQRQPTSSYLMGVQIGRYTLDHSVAPECGVPVEIVHPLGTDVGPTSAFARQPQMVAAFNELFGPYPFDNYRAVITADALEIPLEAQGLSIFGANHVKAGWENERLVAHELAHQWFGNSLTARSWRDIWLHEGFACYAEWLWSECSGGRTAAQHAQQHWARLERLEQDLVISDPGPALMFDDRVYKRGALTLHVLRKSLGDRAFFAMLHAWTSEHAHSVVSTLEFTQHVARFAPAGTDTAVLLSRWLDRAPLPSLV